MYVLYTVQANKSNKFFFIYFDKYTVFIYMILLNVIQLESSPVEQNHNHGINDE